MNFRPILVLKAGILAGVLHCGGVAPAAEQPFLKEIRAFEASDKANPPPKHAFLFLGSSSIRLWKTLEQDFPGKPVINRGFGGSQIFDSVRYAEQIVLPCAPRKIIFYAGDNDLAAGRTPQDVLADFHMLVRRVHFTLPETRLAFIAIKPSPKRWALADKAREANRLVADFCKRNPRLEFIDVFTPMLGKDGKPRPELFVADQLHLNAEGYALWKKLVAPHLK